MRVVRNRAEMGDIIRVSSGPADVAERAKRASKLRIVIFHWAFGRGHDAGWTQVDGMRGDLVSCVGARTGSGQAYALILAGSVSPRSTRAGCFGETFFFQSKSAAMVCAWPERRALRADSAGGVFARNSAERARHAFEHVRRTSLRRSVLNLHFARGAERAIIGHCRTVNLNYRTSASIRSFFRQEPARCSASAAYGIKDGRVF